MDLEVILMRGLPGSGKSTWIQSLRGKTSLHVVSADLFFMNAQGNYEFKQEKIAEAHNQCLCEFVDVCQEQRAETIIVDNTNIATWEISPYYRLAEIFGYIPRIVRMECSSVEKAFRRQKHGVPLELMYKMRNLLITEQLPTWWKENIFLT